MLVEVPLNRVNKEVDDQIIPWNVPSYRLIGPSVPVLSTLPVKRFTCVQRVFVSYESWQCHVSVRVDTNGPVSGTATLRVGQKTPRPSQEMVVTRDADTGDTMPCSRYCSGFVEERLTEKKHAHLPTP